jgi:hypothetical protein
MYVVVLEGHTVSGGDFVARKMYLSSVGQMMIFGTNNRLQSPVSFRFRGDMAIFRCLDHLRLDVLFKVVMFLILHQFKSL